MVLHSWHGFACRSHVAKTCSAELYPAKAFLVGRRYVWRHGLALCRSVVLHNFVPIKMVAHLYAGRAAARLIGLINEISLTAPALCYPPRHERYHDLQVRPALMHRSQSGSLAFTVQDEIPHCGNTTPESFSSIFRKVAGSLKFTSGSVCDPGRVSSTCSMRKGFETLSH